MKIRCSSIGKIMATPRTKGAGLSQTAKSYVQELYLEAEYGIRKEFWSRYTDKGLLVENEAIELVEEMLDFGFLEKNELKYENDYLTGIPDVVTKDYIIDVKSSYNANTFPFFEDEIPNKDYYYQLQGYMELTGREKALLIYCLIDTPEDILLDEIRRESWKRKEIQISEEVEDYVRNLHCFDNLPKHKRLKVYEIEKHEPTIEKIYTKVNECREYYETLKNK
jgi:hypothetical protein